MTEKVKKILKFDQKSFFDIVNKMYMVLWLSPFAKFEN